MVQVWRDAVEEGNQECAQCKMTRPKCTTCPECGEPCVEAPSGRYFPGWGNDDGELPILVTGRYTVMSMAIQSSILSCWHSLPVDHNGVHQASPSELVALSFDTPLQREDLDLYSFVFSSMRQGCYAGMAKADAYKKKTKRTST